MIKIGDNVTPVDGPYFVRGEVKNILVIDNITYADVEWNKPTVSKRVNVKKLTKL